MDAERFRRVMMAFAEVCDLPSKERDRALAVWSARDEGIGREVLRLLAAERQGSGRLAPRSFTGQLPELELPVAEKAPSLSGTRVAQFEVGDRIGFGGMGEVYVGIDTVLGRQVALKAIRRDQRMSETARRRFLREAQMLSSLDHPNICRIYDYLRGEFDDFLVLELIHGRSLREALGQGLPKAQTLSIAEQVADALATAHAAGIVHRDLKLSNVMLTDHGLAKILDFGLARSVELEDRPGRVGDLVTPVPEAGIDASTPFLTATGWLAGTPSAMSPEQIAGRAASAASDMYSFGLLTQELMTGEPPYDPDLSFIEVVEAARHGATRPVSGVDRHLAALIESLTAKEARNRPTAPAVVDRLRWIRDKPRRRLRRIAAAALFALLALGALKYTLDLRRERTFADQRRAQAEDLIGFMLGDLRAKLQPLGRLDVLDDVGDKAVLYFASVSEAELSEGELLSRAEALTQIGEVRLSQHRYDEALASFMEAYRQTATLVIRRPKDGDVLFDRGQAEYWVGYVHWRRLEAELAREWMERYRETSEALFKLDGSRDDWVLEVAYAHHNLAVLALDFGRLEEAGAGFHQEVEVLLSLLEANAGSPDLIEALADAYSWLGTTARRRGSLEHSYEFFSESTAQRAALVEQDPEDATRRFWWAQAMVFEADLVAIFGNRQESVDSYDRAIAILEELVTADPSNRWWQRALAIAQVSRAKVVAVHVAPDQARDRLAAATAALEHLVAGEPEDRLSRRALAVAHRVTARLQGMGGRLTTALAAVARAVELGEALHAEAPRDLDLLGELATTLVIAGELQQAADDQAAALISWHQALDILKEPVADSSFADLLDPWARALAHVGRTEESTTIAMSLSAAGYRSVWHRSGFLSAP